MLQEPQAMSSMSIPMSDRDHQIDRLHDELGMLKTALELFDDPPAETYILTRVLACITEYTQLVDGQLNAVIETAPVAHDGAEDNL